MILVVGATGLLGGTITQMLLEKGKQVRILVRHDSPAAELARRGLGIPAQTLIEAGAQPFYGDLKDPPSLAEACTGIETVISTANSILRGGEDNIETVDLNGNMSLIDQAAKAGVQQFIYVSVLDAQEDSPNPLARAKAVCEGQLMQSGMHYTIINPGFLMEIWLGAVVGAPLQAGLPVTLVGKGENRQAFVAVRDVAAFTAAAVDNPAAKNQHIAVGGPEAYNWNEIVAAAGKALGQSLPVNYVAVGQPVPVLHESMVPLFYALETFETFVDMSETSAVFGIKPTSLEAFTQSFFGQRA